MKKYVLLAVAALVGLTVVSCKQKEIEPEDALSIAGTTITVGKEAASPAITFTLTRPGRPKAIPSGSPLTRLPEKPETSQSRLPSRKTTPGLKEAER